MQRWQPLWCLVGAIWIAGCERPLDEPLDPGPPQISFGPKCSVTLEGAAEKRLDQCTAIATIRDGAPHLYLELYPDREPHDVQRYASILLPRGDWSAGRHSLATAGRVDVKLSDGRRYALEPDGAGRFPINLDLTSTDRADSGDHHYLKGELRVTLRGVSGSEGEVDFTAVID
jgi:hypothetical protein